jgi:hypothetical protein
MPGLTLGLGMDIVGPEMLSASKLFATRIFVESEHTPPSCALPPVLRPLFLFFTAHSTTKWVIAYVHACLAGSRNFHLKPW